MLKSFFIALLLFAANSYAQVDYKLSINYGYNKKDKSIEVTVYNNTWDEKRERFEMVHYPVGLLLDENGDTIQISDDRYYGIGDMSTFRFYLDKPLKEVKIVQFKLHSIRLESLYDEWTFVIDPKRRFDPFDEEISNVEEVADEGPFQNMKLTHEFNQRKSVLNINIVSDWDEGFVSYPSLRVVNEAGDFIGEHRFDTYGLSGEDDFRIELNQAVKKGTKVTVHLSEGHSTEPIKSWKVTL